MHWNVWGSKITGTKEARRFLHEQRNVINETTSIECTGSKNTFNTCKQLVGWSVTH